MKKNGNYRFCVAYIGLNAQTERESWPFPNIEEVLDSLEGFEYYTTLDGFSGFNTVPIEKDDQNRTTFHTPWAEAGDMRVNPQKGYYFQKGV